MGLMADTKKLEAGLIDKLQQKEKSLVLELVRRQEEEEEEDNHRRMEVERENDRKLEDLLKAERSKMQKEAEQKKVQRGLKERIMNREYNDEPELWAAAAAAAVLPESGPSSAVLPAPGSGAPV